MAKRYLQMIENGVKKLRNQMTPEARLGLISAIRSDLFCYRNEILINQKSKTRKQAKL